MASQDLISYYNKAVKMGSFFDGYLKGLPENGIIKVPNFTLKKKVVEI